MTTPAETIQLVLASRWEALAALLGPERGRIEFELINALRELALAQAEGSAADQAAAAQAVLALFVPAPSAYQALLQALRAADAASTKGTAGPAGFVPAQRYTRFPVFFGTSRARSGGDTTLARFSGDRSTAGEPTLGVAEVSLPDDARMGRIDRPRWWRLEFSPDPDKHLMLHSVKVLTTDDFVSRARATLEGAPRKEALVFVHGFNVGFEEALSGAAQLAYDLHFQGLAALYSWPSEGAVARYTVDEANVAWARPHFMRFLALLRDCTGAEAVHLVAHSMGNRLVTEALSALTQTAPAGKAVLREVVLAAPDVDADTFKDLAASFAPKARRCTLYASSRDKALVLSRQVHKYPRAGQSGPDLVVTNVLDTVDATAVDTSLLGHSYYADNRSVLSDMFHLIRNGLAPADRGLDTRDRHGAPYWAFRA